MSFLVLATSAVSLGFLHGLGGDHLMAIAVLAVRRRDNAGADRRIVATALGFASGHALLLGLGATAAVVFGWVMPAAVESGAERLGGVLLMALGMAGLWTLWSGRAYGHVHTVAGEPRWHMHVGSPGAHPAVDHRVDRSAAVMGAVFAVSSLRMLMLLTPFGEDVEAMSITLLLALVVLFAVGLLLSMSLFGVVLSRVLSLRAVEHLGRAAALVMALASIGLGVYWVM